MATTTTTITNTGGIANSLNTPARADEDDVSVDCGTIGSSNDKEYIQVYRERILVGGSFFPPDNSESGSGRSEWNGMLHDISSLFPATKSETDSSSLFSRPNSNSIMAIFAPHRSTDGSENDEIIIARNPSISSYFPAYFSDTASSVSKETRLDRAYSAIQHAMSWPEDEFRHALILNTRRKILWFSEDDWSSRFHECGLSLDDNATVDLINPKAMDELREIATRMIRSGFKKECIQVYSTVRRDALDDYLLILGIEKLSIEEVQKIEWNSLNEKMKKWIQAVKIVVWLILSSEKSLCDQIFCGANETKEICFNETVKGCVRQLLNFGKAIAIGRRSHEKLFGILNMYDVMVEAMVRLEVLVTDDVVINDARDVLSRLSKAACGTFAEFKKTIQSGENHPLKRYVMNYVKVIVDYSETLNFLLEIREDERGPSLDDNASVNLINPKVVDEVREIATTMIRFGFKKECIQVYSTVRRNALDECLVILGIEKLSIEEVQKIEWNSLNEKMKKWIQAVKIVVRLIFSSEKSLCDQIFCGADETKEICFNEIVKGCLMQLLNFGEAVAIGRRSPEKLFRILSMYDVMAEALARLKVLVTDDVMIKEARDVLSRLSEEACRTFAEFENAVQSEISKKPMQSGENRPLTRYVMNYVKVIVDYSETLNFLLEIREDERGLSLDDNVSVDLINPKAVDEVREIATTMIRSDFKKECIQVYSTVRRDALDECLVILGIEKLSIEEVQKIEWNSLNEKMKKWIQVVKIVVRLILNSEKSLCDQIFCCADEAKEICFNKTVKGCVMQLLNFGKAVAIRRRSHEKLFRILDMYDVMAEAMARLEVLVTDDVVINEARDVLSRLSEAACATFAEFENEARDVLSRLSEAACGTFAEFENAVQSEISKKPMQSGENHPLTWYVMNYVKVIVDYSETLNFLLEIREDERGPSLYDNTSVDLINPKAMDEVKEIATTMIRSGFKKECIQFYSTIRSDALDECLVILGIEKLSIEEVQKIEWNSLNEKMKKWIQAVKIVVRLILSSEKSLCDQIFCGADETREICFNETVKGCMMQLLNFAKAIVIGRRSHEKLFRILDMYDVMAEAMARLEVLVTDDVVINEARDVLFGLSEAACGTFVEFENAVQSENWKKPMQNGVMEIRENERGPSMDDNASVDLIDPIALVKHREIATRMIRSGFKKECIQVYSTVCRNALDECLVILGIEKLSIEEVRKIEWNSLDEKMKKWIQAVKIVVRLILSGEKSLCDQIFCGADETKEICFNETVKGCVMQLLNFSKAVAIGKRSHKKLFRILDMYEVMAEALATLEVLVTDDVMINEARDVLSELGEAACGTFAEFENVVQSETSKKPTQSGEIHPLTWYVMNYVKLIVNYSETLNLLLEIHEDDDQLEPLRNDDSDSLRLTPVARQLLVLITSLHSNLEEKSKLYEDGALQYIFLMNNIMYVVQKVKDSDLGGLLGDNWVRKRRGQIRQYATSYLRASWTQVLHCLKDEGVGRSSSNASRVVLKERFKNFNACFEEIYRVQTAWKVPNAQLREELRISISEKVISAYRSFMGRFGNQVESGRHAEKYIKYTAYDLENYLLDLFEGSPRVLHHMRRKST